MFISGLVINLKTNTVERVELMTFTPKSQRTNHCKGTSSACSSLYDSSSQIKPVFSLYCVDVVYIGPSTKKIAKPLAAFLSHEGTEIFNSSLELHEPTRLHRSIFTLTTTVRMPQW